MTTGEVVRAWSKECEQSVMKNIFEDAIRGYMRSIFERLPPRGIMFKRAMRIG